MGKKQNITAGRKREALGATRRVAGNENVNIHKLTLHTVL
jgi:hypothetical protein